MMEYQLFNCNCFDYFGNIQDESIDLILTDPPYGVTNMEWDSMPDLEQLWGQFNRILKPTGNIIIFASGRFTYQLYVSNPDNYRYKLIWQKNVPTGLSSAAYMPMRYFEEIMVFKKSNAAVKQITYNPIMKERIGKHKECYRYNHYAGQSNHIDIEKKPKQYDPDFVQPSDILSFDVVPNRAGKNHPTEKPVALLEYLIKTFSNPNDTILDCFMGSGSTGVACLNQNRAFIGIELLHQYYDIASKRLSDCQSTLKSKLF